MLVRRFYVCAVDDDPCDEATPTAAPDPDGASETRQEAQIIGYAMLIALAGFVLVCESLIDVRERACRKVTTTMVWNVDVNLLTPPQHKSGLVHEFRVWDLY